jgi:hypothetical protein
MAQKFGNLLAIIRLQKIQGGAPGRGQKKAAAAATTI